MNRWLYSLPIGIVGALLGVVALALLSSAEVSPPEPAQISGGRPAASAAHLARVYAVVLWRFTPDEEARLRELCLRAHGYFHADPDRVTCFDADPFGDGRSLYYPEHERWRVDAASYSPDERHHPLPEWALE